MIRNRILFAGVLSLGLFCTQCKKGPGVGGRATIQGKVYEVVYDKKYLWKLDSGYSGNQTVNILFGTDLGVDGNQKTSYDGTYTFQYMRPGKYKLFTYSRSRKTNLPDSAVVRDVEITGNTQVLTLPDIRIVR